MEKSPFDYEYDIVPDIKAIPPVVELLLDEDEERRRQAGAVNNLLDSWPKSAGSMREALAKGVEPGVAAGFYQSLDELLSDPDYQRLLLYLPFEVLPEADWRPADESLNQASQGFKSTYLKAWLKLLSVQDVRANFLDGDAYEDILPADEMPYVVKAAHLAPKLVERGLIEATTVEKIYHSASDPVLRRSLDDALLIMSDLKLCQHQADFSALPGISVDPMQLTPGRLEWLSKRFNEELVANRARQVSSVVTAGMMTPGMIDFLLSAYNMEPEAIVEGIGLALEEAAYYPARARRLYEGFQPELDRLQSASYAKVMRRLHSLQIVSADELRQRGLHTPELSGKLSDNLENLGPEIQALKASLERLAGDELLSDSVYPVYLIGGSRLKGYGEKVSDLDLAVLIKPGTPVCLYKEIEQRLSRTLIINDRAVEAVQFWLDRDGADLSVRDLRLKDGHAANKYWTHIIFGSAWLGDEALIKDLQRQLVPGYFKAGPERRLYLERMEQDLLQYRLMHKGYARNFVPQLKEAKLPHGKRIDAGSVFWDAGYRRLATKLFVNRVFLPKSES